jgi:hypothetical protein
MLPVTGALDIAEEMATRLRGLAEPVQRGDSVQSCIERAARRAGIAFGRAKRLWYREVATVTALEADLIRARSAALEARQVQARAELARVDAALESIRP